MRRSMHVAVLCALSACVAAGGTSDSDASALRALVERFAAGFVAGDPDAVARCITADFVAMVPGEPVVAGREVARGKIAADLARLEVRELGFEIEELHVAGDWGWGRASSTAEVAVRDSGEVGRIRGKTLWIFRRGADGVWRIARDASSSDEL
jgi:uncharacterized protein (TIGR02246 family)